MIKNNNIKDQLRNASFPYKLILDTDTKLPAKSDLDIIEDPEDDELRYGNYQALSFKDRTLTIRSGWRKYFEQYIQIADDHILVSCNCGRKVTGLCEHAVRLFLKMIEINANGFFERFKQYPYTDAAFFNQYLTLQSHYRNIISAVPRPEYGHIYNYENQINGSQFSSDPLFLPPPVKLFEEDLSITAYAIAFHCDFPIPFLIPCNAIRAADSRSIKAFVNFYDPEIAPKRLAPMDQLLHSYSIAFNKMVDFETVHKKHRDASKEEVETLRYSTFNCWKRIIPLLKDHQYLFYRSFRNKIYYNGNVSKSSMQRVSVSDEQINFHFTLSQYSGHYKLTMQAKRNNQCLEIGELLPEYQPFFFSLSEAPDTFYQFACLEEAKAVAELIKAGGTFTILDDDLENFNQNVLSKLTKQYTFTFNIDNKPTSRFLSVKGRHIRVRDEGEYVAFIPEIQYDQGHVFAVQSGGAALLRTDSKEFQILNRDKNEEAAFRDFFITLHPAFIKQQDLPCFYLPKETLKSEVWFAKTAYNLMGTGIQFTGMETLTDIDYDMLTGEMKIDIREENGWFDIDVTMRYGEYELCSEEIHKALKKRSNILELENGKTIYLPDAFFEKLTTVFRSGMLTRKGVKLAGQHYMLLDQLYDPSERPDLANMVAARDRLFSQQDKISLIEVPDHVNASLRPYQLIGFSWLCHLYTLKWGGLLADDMGLGKTLQVLTLLQHLKNKGLSTAPHLLLAPTSLLYNWEQEAEKFCPGLSILVFHGTQREKDAAALQNYDLIITSYGTAAVDVLFLQAISLDYLILDEAQAIKNPFSKKFKMVLGFKTRNRLALTGTPVENSSADLYALMNFINPNFFGSLRMFKENLGAKGDEQDSDRAGTLLKMTKPFILRRTKKQVATDLPPKTEMIIWCEMEPKQRKIYDHYRKQFKAELSNKIDSDGLENSKLHVLKGLITLRQICNSPTLIKDAPAFDEHSCKIIELMEHIMEKTAGHKLLVFSAFTGMLGLIRSCLDEQGVAYAYLDGKTKLNQRKAAVTNFQENKDCRVFLISLKAGGTGLNLTAADYVYLVDPWWNPAVENQAIDRCYRIGQDKHVMAYRMICKDTLEEKILEIQDRKRKLAGELIPTDEGILKSLGKDDLLKLFG